ncbi:MAG: hypothetical protein SF029_01565 [bacterium]|nr:hypothetical protein [bacterium]
MPKRDKLLAELQGEDRYGVLLMAQMDAVPETLQFVVVTTQMDEAAGGLRDQGRYIIRALGVREHRVSVGIFGNLRLLDDHPLLYEYNTPPTGLFFRGTPDDANELVLDIFQGYASTFGPWRQIPTYFNLNRPLLDLVSGGGDLLGEMPKPLAERLDKVLQQHRLETKVMEGKRTEPKLKVLLLDDSYVVALDFSIDELGKV